MAEFIMKDLVREQGVADLFAIESAATTSEEIGRPVYPPAKRMLETHGIDCSGKRAAVIGRSLVVGRPASMLLLHRNATVTICHTRTADLPATARGADILVVAAGQMERFGAEYLRTGQIVVDVGIGWNEEKGKLCGDLRFEEAEEIVEALTPVPGGVGAVTTAVLARHVTDAALRSLSPRS